jgi:ABC-type lipoprotein release transport system permease subunit
MNMNPLSPLTYYRRHKRQTLLLVGLVSLMTLGVCAMVRLLDSVPEGYQTAGNYLTRVSLVSAGGPMLDPGVVSRIRTYPGVAQAIQEKGLDISLPPIISEHHLFGISKTDMQTLMDACDLRLKEGRLPRPSTNEMTLSEEMVNAMGIQIGDRIDRTIGRNWSGESWYDAIPAPLELVGILEGTGPGPSVRMGFVSHEYVSNHELFGPPWVPGLVVIPQEGHKAEVDEFLEAEIASLRIEVMTHRLLSEHAASFSFFFYLMFGVVDVVVAAVMALVIGVINQISQTKRLEEFGVLNALGHGKGQLVRRLTLEAVGMTGMGWVGGLALSWLLFAALKVGFYEPRGLVLDLADLTPIWFSLPIPLVTAVVVASSTMRTFSRLDAVAVVERGKLSMEADGKRKAGKRSRVPNSSIKPLSPKTFYQRHRHRGVILLVSMGAMILGVSFPAFLFAPMGDAMQAFAEPLRQIGIITPRMEGTVDPGVTAQARTHPTVAQVIPAVELELAVQVPPLDWPISVYGVSEVDLQTLVNLYGVQVKEGRLPRPHASEVVLSEAIALNRDLHVGDEIGQPANKDDHNIPTEMVIVGILSRPSASLHYVQSRQLRTGSSQDRGRNDLWLGFASYEYLTSHELYASHPVHLLVIPNEGQKAEMDAWLREEVNPELVEAYTFEWMRTNYRLMALIFLAVFGVVEVIIAIVAAAALAVLSYVFFAQRRQEFGVLHAIGHSRPWLILRTVRETAIIVTVAWLASAVVCGIGLTGVQFGLYAPRGLSLNFFNPAPWLFTLPIPLTVIAASGGLVAWMLRRLDPVSIIERR